MDTINDQVKYSLFNHRSHQINLLGGAGFIMTWGPVDLSHLFIDESTIMENTT